MPDLLAHGRGTGGPLARDEAEVGALRVDVRHERRQGPDEDVRIYVSAPVGDGAVEL